LKGLTGQSRIINVRSETNLSEGINEARDVLLSGGVVAFPTESFYGLAVNPMDDEAVDLLFRLKKREPDQPILILIPFQEALELYAAEISELALTLTRKYWPGGLTLLFKATPRISQRLTAGTGKIGVRLSSHPIATALAQSINSPITGTSANLSGHPACRNALEVYNYFKMGVLILDGGETAGGKGSTILDVSVTPPKILREGMIAADQLDMG
jgi:L-threonylcarbamoyladenylate synthase